MENLILLRISGFMNVFFVQSYDWRSHLSECSVSFKVPFTET